MGRGLWGPGNPDRPVGVTQAKKTWKGWGRVRKGGDGCDGGRRMLQTEGVYLFTTQLTFDLWPRMSKGFSPAKKPRRWWMAASWNVQNVSRML